ncbi:MAG: hypothetical protein ABIR17_04525 [Pseudolysinimonas sp.]|uniref:hypothetical protein n=1 Tax=Pseudolysinimonas sp. TaxID=2680009 RepID=UPI00326460BE
MDIDNVDIDDIPNDDGTDDGTAGLRSDGGTTEAERLANRGSGVSVPQPDPTGAGGVIPQPEVPLPDGEMYPEEHEKDK